MDRAFLKQVDRLYQVATQVGRTETVLQVGQMVLIVRNSSADLKSAWDHFAKHVTRDRGILTNHLRYFFAVLRNVRGVDAVTLLELNADVSFSVSVDVEPQSVDLVA
jgi:hypothetical protein